MNIYRYYTCDLVNGEGVRLTVFVSGCLHGCKGCYNRTAVNKLAGDPFTTEFKNKILDLCESHDGLSLSGGDPLYPDNRENITELCKEFKQRYPNKDIWLWTGYLFEDIKNLEVIKYIDVLIDGKYDKDHPSSKPWRGSDNQKLYRLKNGEVLKIE